MQLEEITAKIVNSAIDIYMRLAYDDVVSRNEHTIHFDESSTIEEVLSRFVSEDSSLKSWSLRLGSQDYPHMKLMLREAYIKGSFAFSVDRHDCFAFNRDTVGAEKWVALQEHNYKLKKSIEDTWYNEGIPCFRKLREGLMTQTDYFKAMKSGTILLVDNDQDALAIMELLLNKAGYQVQTAQSVKEAVKLINNVTENNEEYICVLVDLLLADGMGQDVIAELRANEATQNVPVAIMSGMPEEEVECGAADEFIRKPFSADNIETHLKKMISIDYDGGGKLI